MRTWTSKDDLLHLLQIVSGLRGRKLLEPTDSSSVDLRGLRFPMIPECEACEFPPEATRQIVGRQEFSDAILRDVDLAHGRLDFSEWTNCRFERVCFDRASLRQVCFSGCQFENCSFRSTDLSNASFSIGRAGTETEFESTVFDKADFRGAACSNPVFRATLFLNCKLAGFVFEGAYCDRVTFSGRYEQLNFVGVPGDNERNRLRIDLSDARVTWLDANDGIDLHGVTLPSDGSCLILQHRIQAIDHICSQLQAIGPMGKMVAQTLARLFSDRAVSALSLSQDTILISKAMLADFIGSDDPVTVTSLFQSIWRMAQAAGYLVE